MPSAINRGKRLLPLAASMVACGMVYAATTLYSSSQFCVVAVNGQPVITGVPIARTAKQQQHGLSHREDVSVGMFFVWDKPAIRSFWMKDTLKPLSVGFVDKDNKLFQITNMEAGSLSLHFSRKKAVAALELPKGAFQQRGIKLGDSVTCD
jgi:uncharacterized membrane protein (UPF0127 family)